MKILPLKWKVNPTGTCTGIADNDFGFGYIFRRDTNRKWQASARAKPLGQHKTLAAAKHAVQSAWRKFIRANLAPESTTPKLHHSIPPFRTLTAAQLHIPKNHFAQWPKPSRYSQPETIARIVADITGRFDFISPAATQALTARIAAGVRRYAQTSPFIVTLPRQSRAEMRKLDRIRKLINSGGHLAPYIAVQDPTTGKPRKSRKGVFSFTTTGKEPTKPVIKRGGDKF